MSTSSSTTSTTCISSCAPFLHVRGKRTEHGATAFAVAAATCRREPRRSRARRTARDPAPDSCASMPHARSGGTSARASSRPVRARGRGLDHTACRRDQRADRRGAGGVLDRVAEQVRDHLLDPKRIPRRRHSARRTRRRSGSAPRPRPPQALDDLAHELAEIGREFEASTGRSRCARRRAACDQVGESLALRFVRSIFASELGSRSRLHPSRLSSWSWSTASGVLSSCDAIERNSSRRRTASWALREPQALVLGWRRSVRSRVILREADELAVACRAAA